MYSRKIHPKLLERLVEKFLINFFFFTQKMCDINHIEILIFFVFDGTSNLTLRFALLSDNFENFLF